MLYHNHAKEGAHGPTQSLSGSLPAEAGAGGRSDVSSLMMVLRR